MVNRKKQGTKEMDVYDVAEAAELLWDRFSSDRVTELVGKSRPYDDPTYRYGFRWETEDGLRVISVLVLRTGVTEELFVLGPKEGAQVDRLRHSSRIRNDAGVMRLTEFRSGGQEQLPKFVSTWVNMVRQAVVSDPKT